MIEKLEAPRVHGQYCTCDERATRLKINEVVAAVNELRHHVSHPTKKPSGFRPLHIEDGQVVASNLYEAPVLHEDAKSGKYVSVPEAEPQEQELTLNQAISNLIGAVRDVDSGKYTQGSIWKGLEDIHAAAHREYAQPVPQDLGLVFEKALNRLQNTVATLAVSKCMNTPAGFAEIAECRQAVWFAAQPGKGV